MWTEASIATPRHIKVFYFSPRPFPFIVMMAAFSCLIKDHRITVRKLQDVWIGTFYPNMRRSVLENFNITLAIQVTTLGLFSLFRQRSISSSISFRSARKHQRCAWYFRAPMNISCLPEQAWIPGIVFPFAMFVVRVCIQVSIYIPQ